MHGNDDGHAEAECLDAGLIPYRCFMQGGRGVGQAVGHGGGRGLVQGHKGPGGLDQDLVAVDVISWFGGDGSFVAGEEGERGSDRE